MESGSAGKPPLMYFPGELTPTGYRGHSFSSSSSSNHASHQSSSSSSHHSFGVHGGQHVGGSIQQGGNLHQVGLLGGGSLQSGGVISQSGGKQDVIPVGGLHYSSSSHSNSSASQASNSASHHSATFHTFGPTGTLEKHDTLPSVSDKDAHHVHQTLNKADKAKLQADTSHGKEIDGGQVQTVKDKVDEGYGNIGSSSWADKWNSFTNWGSNTAQDIADAAHSTAHTIRDQVLAGVNKIPGIWERFTEAIKGLGTSIHQGAAYCAHVLQQKTDDIQSSEFLQKLEGKVEEGNEEVMQFFTVLGDKISNWSQHHANDGNIDDGLSGDDGQTSQTVVLQQTQDFQREDFPDFFQDEQVRGEIEKLVLGGIIQQEEANLFTQQRQGRP